MKTMEEMREWLVTRNREDPKRAVLRTSMALSSVKAVIERTEMREMREWLAARNREDPKHAAFRTGMTLSTVRAIIEHIAFERWRDQFWTNHKPELERRRGSGFGRRL